MYNEGEREGGRFRSRWGVPSVGRQAGGRQWPQGGRDGRTPAAWGRAPRRAVSVVLVPCRGRARVVATCQLDCAPARAAPAWVHSM